MSFLNTNRVKSVTPRFTQITDEESYNLLVDSQEIIPFGTIVMVSFSGSSSILFGTNKPIDQALTVDVNSVSIPTPPAEGSFILEATDGDVEWAVEGGE